MSSAIEDKSAAKTNGAKLKGSSIFPLVQTIQFIKKRFTTLSTLEKAHGNIFTMGILGNRHVVITDAEVVRFLFKSEHKLVYVDRGGSFNALFGEKSISRIRDKDEHAFLRKAMAKTFTPKMFANRIGLITQLIRDNLDDWATNGIRDARFQLKKLYFAVGVHILFGEKYFKADPNVLDELLLQYEAFIGGLLTFPINFPGTPFNKALKARKFLEDKFGDYLDELVSEETIASTSDEQRTMIQILATEADPKTGKQYGKEDLLEHTKSVLFAAQDTSSGTTSYILKALAQRKDIVELLKKEQDEHIKEHGTEYTLEGIKKMKYLDSFIFELHRRLLAVDSTFRTAKVDFDIPGYDISIKKGQRMVLHWGLAQYDHNYDHFTRSTEEKINLIDVEASYDYLYNRDGKPVDERFILVFGGGKRVCAGKVLADAELRILTAELVRNYEWSYPGTSHVIPHPLPHYPDNTVIDFKRK